MAVLEFILWFISPILVLILAAEYHALPVVENKKLVGIVTTTDLIHYFVEQY